jgi:hypothetical protein
MKILSTILTLIFLFISSTAFAIPASSDIEPAKYTKCRGKTQVAYNIKQVDIIDPDGKTRKAWQYEYVEVESPVTKAKFKEALKQQDLKKKDTNAWTPDDAAAEFLADKEPVPAPK